MNTRIPLTDDVLMQDLSALTGDSGDHGAAIHSGFEDYRRILNEMLEQESEENRRSLEYLASVIIRDLQAAGG